MGSKISKQTCYHNSEDWENERWLSNGDIFFRNDRKEEEYCEQKKKGKENLHLSSNTREESEENAP